MNDRPNVEELIAAARTYLEQELIPTLTDARLRFQTLVAANILAICERQIRSEEEHLAEEWERLGLLLHKSEPLPSGLSFLRRGIRERNLLLCQRIGAGNFDEASHFRKLCSELRWMVERKLEVAN